MEDLVDLIATDASASDISDKIKERLYAKASEYVTQHDQLSVLNFLVMRCLKHLKQNLILKLRMNLIQMRKQNNVVYQTIKSRTSSR